MPPSPARELASSAFMSFWMNNIAVELALVTPLLAKYYGGDAPGSRESGIEPPRRTMKAPTRTATRRPQRPGGSLGPSQRMD